MRSTVCTFDMAPRCSCLTAEFLQISVNGIDHQVIVVTLDQKNFIVDVGYGAQVSHHWAI